MQEREYPVEAVETGLRILEFIADDDGPTLQEIADGLSIPKSTVFRHLKTFEQNDYVTKSNGEYYISVTLLGQSVTGGRWYRVYQNSKGVIDELAEETGDRAVLGIEENEKASVVYYAEGSNAIGTDVHLGCQFSLHCTAIGKVLLAFLPEDRRTAVLEDIDLHQRTPNTITDRDQLEKELVNIRETGVAFDDKERLDGVRGVAVPIFDQSNETLYGGLTIAGATTDFYGSKFREEIPDLLQRASEKVKMDLKFK